MEKWDLVLNLLVKSWLNLLANHAKFVGDYLSSG